DQKARFCGSHHSIDVPGSAAYRLRTYNTQPHPITPSSAVHLTADAKPTRREKSGKSAGTTNNALSLFTSIKANTKGTAANHPRVTRQSSTVHKNSSEAS